MSLIVISDLHIWGPEDPLYFSLLSLIQKRVKEKDIVIFAGDIFDLFVGNKTVFTQRYSGFLQALTEAGSRGIQMHYIEGNHDFFIRRAFQGVKGLATHSHDMSLEIQGKKFFFSHGDTVDKWDYSYRLLRVLFRSPLMKVLVYLAPGQWLDKIGKMSSEQSRKSKPRLPMALPVQRMERLRYVYRSFAAEKLSHGYDFVVMGHCHDLDEMHFNIGGRRGQYVNVGFPRAHGSFLVWSPGEEEIHREKLP